MTPAPRASLAALGLLLPLLKPYWPRVLAAIAALLLAAGLTLALGQGLKHLIDDGFAGGLGALDRAALVMGVLITALAISTTTRFYLVSWLGERVAADLRQRFFDHVTGLSPSYFETARIGDVMSRLTADIGLLQSLIGSAISMGVRQAITGAGAFLMLVLTNAKLAGLIALILPMVVLPLVFFGRRERRLSKAAQERIGDLAAQAEETLGGIRAIQAFTQEDRARARFAAGSDAAVRAALRRVFSRSLLILAVILLGFGAITFSLWVGGRDVIEGRISGGELSAFVFYAVLMASSGATVSELWGEIQRAAAAADRLGEVLAITPAIAAPANPVPLPPAQGRVAFEAVTLRYPTRPDSPALMDFSLVVEPGEAIALVGPSGAGKTSVLSLLLRFYDPSAGRILLDGAEVIRLDPRALRTRLGLVPQEPVIFSASIAENIRLGRPDATDAEVAAAAQAAAAAEFIAALPQGYATELGTRGVTLSGGQRQRIAIARAILRDPTVLLLDEATSALDAESEFAVQQALARLCEGRTSITVAHRLATVRRADRIVVMDQGRIIATGTHEALLAEGGLYARLAALQFTDGAGQGRAPLTQGAPQE